MELGVNSSVDERSPAARGGGGGGGRSGRAEGGGYWKFSGGNCSLPPPPPPRCVRPWSAELHGRRTGSLRYSNYPLPGPFCILPDLYYYRLSGVLRTRSVLVSGRHPTASTGPGRAPPDVNSGIWLVLRGSYGVTVCVAIMGSIMTVSGVYVVLAGRLSCTSRIITPTHIGGRQAALA